MDFDLSQMKSFEPVGGNPFVLTWAVEVRSGREGRYHSKVKLEYFLLPFQQCGILIDLVWVEVFDHPQQVLG